MAGWAEVTRDRPRQSLRGDLVESGCGLWTYGDHRDRRFAEQWAGGGWYFSGDQRKQFRGRRDGDLRQWDRDRRESGVRDEDHRQHTIERTRTCDRDGDEPERSDHDAHKWLHLQ